MKKWLMAAMVAAVVTACVPTEPKDIAGTYISAIMKGDFDPAKKYVNSGESAAFGMFAPMIKQELERK